MSSRIVALRSIIPSVHVVKKSRSRPSQHIKADLTLCYCPCITFSSWLTTFQMSVLVWRGILGSLLISSSIEIAYAARTVSESCLLYTSDAADDLLCVDLGGRR